MKQKTVKEDIGYTNEKSSNRKQYLWLEGIFVVSCIVIGFLLRMYQLQIQNSSFLQENALFENAMILKNNVIPYMDNNLAYAYTYWMRFICSFFGNFAINILVAQVIMEEIAILFIYFALRNLNLRDGAQFLMVMLQFLFFKGFVTDIIPECLLLFSIGFAGWIFSKYISNYKGAKQTLVSQYFKLFFVSILVSVPIYFNWIGCILPVFMIFGIFVSTKCQKLKQIFLLLFGTVAGVVLLFGCKAIANGKLLYEIGLEYYQNLSDFAFDTLIIFYLGTIVIAMLVSKIVSIIREIAVGYSEKKLPQNITEELITKDIETKDIETKDIETKDIETKDIETKDIETKDIERQELNKPDSFEITKVEELPIPEENIWKKQIRFLENPLPVPKKHIRKEMDYAMIPTEDMMKFDLELEPGKEEFDI